jgi:hypothetical protein
MPLSDELLAQLLKLTSEIDPVPWTAIVEGRDQTAGDSFIMVGDPSDRREDIYVSRDVSPVSPAVLDFIASARNVLPELLEELLTLRARQRL